MSNEINDIYNNSIPPLGATDCFRKLWGLSPIWQDIFMSDGVPYEVFIASEESDNTFLGGSITAMVNILLNDINTWKFRMNS